MLYHLLTPLSSNFFGFNVFTYISFRAAGATVTAILLAFVVGPIVIKRLNSLGVGQVIRADGPSSHQTKRGTPTMGGLIIIVCTIIPTLLWARLDSRYVLVAAAATLWMGAIGFVDDYLKIVQGKSRGLVARHKLLGQVTFGIALGSALLLWPVTVDMPANATALPFAKYILVLMTPILYVAFVTFVVAGSSNAVNITDGLDGLAAGLTVFAAAAFAVFAYVFGRFDYSDYLFVYYLPGAGELAIFCASLMGAALGFLWFNAHPSEVFMGDTGSLAIGGAFGTVAILLKSEFLLLLVGGVFAAETFSVIIQTSVFRWRKKRYGIEYARQHRVFRMAPIHHHFEQLGWSEPKVVTRFYIIGVMCALLALATLKIR
ncbi:MAG: phospho-N-acetylmuramoyl-pentapeptide-transferase [Gemmatimonadota bacterium]|nr:MAG: phospho-N-acetylmuramoyl-pentapeptide-transferase [Gemmatimonadota bacterium]